MSYLRPFALSFLSVGLLVGCAGGGGSRVGVSPSVEVSEKEQVEVAPAPPEVSETVVLEAGRPYTGFDASSSSQLGAEELFTTLAAYDAVCLGERHDQPIDHFAQLETIRAFGERQTFRGFELGVGFEMVRRRASPALRRYQAGEIDRDEFLVQTDWEREWGFPIHYYDPLFRAATQVGAPALALGVERDVTRTVAEGGLDALKEEDAARLPELVLDDPEHRALFDLLMGGHPGGEEMPLDQFYTAQVIWDESMADTSAAFLLERRPLRKLLIVAGVAHCHRSAIPARLERRTGMQVANLLVADGTPVPTEGDSVEARIASGYDYQVVFDR